MIVHYKDGDTRPYLRGYLLDAYGNRIDLTDAVTVYAKIKRPDVPEGYRKDAVIVGDPGNGEVVIMWDEGDLTPAGVYYAEFHIVFNDGTDMHVPNSGLITIIVDKVIEEASV